MPKLFSLDPVEKKRCMFKTRLKPVLFLCGVVLLCAFDALRTLAQSAADQPASSYTEFLVPAGQLDDLQKAALQGNAEAALKLANFYNFSTIDPEKGLYWTTIAAENGSVVGMYNLGQSLRHLPDWQSKARAKYWFKKVVDGGGPIGDEAQKQLLDLEK
jgi:TPR repeat protein